MSITVDIFLECRPSFPNNERQIKRQFSRCWCKIADASAYSIQTGFSICAWNNLNRIIRLTMLYFPVVFWHKWLFFRHFLRFKIQLKPAPAVAICSSLNMCKEDRKKKFQVPMIASVSKCFVWVLLLSSSCDCIWKIDCVECLLLGFGLNNAYTQNPIHFNEKKIDFVFVCFRSFFSLSSLSTRASSQLNAQCTKFSLSQWVWRLLESLFGTGLVLWWVHRETISKTIAVSKGCHIRNQKKQHQHP